MNRAEEVLLEHLDPSLRAVGEDVAVEVLVYRQRVHVGVDLPVVLAGVPVDVLGAVRRGVERGGPAETLFGRVLGSFPPATADSLLVIALIAAIE